MKFNHIEGGGGKTEKSWETHDRGSERGRNPITRVRVVEDCSGDK